MTSHTSSTENHVNLNDSQRPEFVAGRGVDYPSVHAEAIPVADRGVGRPASVAAATEEVVNSFLQHSLPAGLYLLTNQRLARTAGRA